MIEPVLVFSKVFTRCNNRLAHLLWQAGRKDFALYLQSLSSRVFQVDIHPAAKIGKGVMFDHATGIVIGGGHRRQLLAAAWRDAWRYRQ